MNSFLNLGLLFQIGLIVGFFICWGFGRRQIIIGAAILLWFPSYLIYESFYNAYFAWWAWWPYWIILSSAMILLLARLDTITPSLESFLKNKFNLPKNWKLNKYKISSEQIKQEKLIIFLYCFSIWNHFIQMLLATGLEQFWFGTTYNWIQALTAMFLMLVLSEPGMSRLLNNLRVERNDKYSFWLVITIAALTFAIITEATYFNIAITGAMVVLPITYKCYLLLKQHGKRMDYNQFSHSSDTNKKQESQEIQPSPPRSLLIQLYELDLIASKISNSNDNDFIKAGKLLDLKLKKEILRSKYSSFYEHESMLKKIK